MVTPGRVRVGKGCSLKRVQCQLQRWLLGPQGRRGVRRPGTRRRGYCPEPRMLRDSAFCVCRLCLRCAKTLATDEGSIIVYGSSIWHVLYR